MSFPEIEKFDHLPPPRVEGATAFVSIMEGCSKYCTFCVVPYTRGEEVSRPFDDVLTEVADLADQGVMEVTLLGQNVNAYQGSMSDGAVADFATLLEYVAEVPGIERIRYTTSHPREMTPRLIAAHGAIDKLVPQLHLPVQSGSDRVLAAMKRGYTAHRIQVDRAPLARRAPRHLALVRFHRRVPGRDRRGFCTDDETRRRRRLRRRVQLHLQPASGHAGRRVARPGAAGRSPGAVAAAAGPARIAIPRAQRRHGRQPPARSGHRTGLARRARARRTNIQQPRRELRRRSASNSHLRRRRHHTRCRTRCVEN